MNDRKLKEYQQKRNPEKSGEPDGNTDNLSKEHVFVIQKHDASQLHYDFRLQVGDVLVSWAVPKGLSTAANEKRLAIQTEDHPLDYAKFEGVIPEGEYGAGTVLVWDIGDYVPLTEDESHEKSMREALKEGALKFTLHGQKLKGSYAMARINSDNDKNQWVIFKLDDEEADARRNPVSTEPDSVLSGRSLEEIAKEYSNGE